ncbi:hypothetical protein HYALB_00000919 [Hymenoscyphus albidus]|uniref:Catalase core domain-containing protein n=1 Tax=Hymenoscyphus albidus TaxID=595503 RepID=A0A9N9L975_9HELO|nr:hypothetical protein HYALB_00000919 [Hymenoscyphus albidus]
MPHFKALAYTKSGIQMPQCSGIFTITTKKERMNQCTSFLTEGPLIRCDIRTPFLDIHISLHSPMAHSDKFTQPDGSFRYVKIHLKTDQGTRNFSGAEATKVAGEAPDYNVKDLFEAIEKKNLPTWTAYLQVMEPKDAETYRWNIFDMTKVWPHADYPLIPFGKLELNRNPQNYFQDIEQAAFSPSTMVPGIEASADPMLQARMFSYPDAQRYRLGVNYQQLPPNYPRSPVYSPFQRDGASNYRGNYGPDPNYVRTSLRSAKYGESSKAHDEWIGKVTVYSTEIQDDDFVQARGMWEVFGKTGQQEAFVSNVAAHLSGAIARVRRQAVEVFAKVDADLAERIEKAMEG